MLNLLPRAQVPRKAGAKLQHFHETNKSFAKFYLIIRQNHTSKPTYAPSLTSFVINNKVLIRARKALISPRRLRGARRLLLQRDGAREFQTHAGDNR